MTGSARRPTGFALPDPPLSDGVVRLRPWMPPDGPALAQAWQDPELQRWTAVPPAASLELAARWVASEALRRQRGLALDLVVAPADPHDPTVLGEVGAVPLGGGPDRAELGWWIGAPHRRQGYATRAVALFAAWLTHQGFADLFAEVDVDNLGSVRVAERAGLRLRLVTAPEPEEP